MLLILPFQFAWAAGASVCTHEKSPLSTHFGHHAVPSASTVADADVDDGSQSVDDCTVCHLVSLKSPICQVDSDIVVSGFCAAPHPPPFTGSHLPDAPERPQWNLAA